MSRKNFAPPRESKSKRSNWTPPRSDSTSRPPDPIWDPRSNLRPPEPSFGTLRTSDQESEVWRIDRFPGVTLTENWPNPCFPTFWPLFQGTPFPGPWDPQDPDFVTPRSEIRDLQIRDPRPPDPILTQTCGTLTRRLSSAHICRLTMSMWIPTSQLQIELQMCDPTNYSTQSILRSIGPIGRPRKEQTKKPSK